MAQFTRKITKWFSVPDDDQEAEIEIIYLNESEILALELETTNVSGSSEGGKFKQDVKSNPQTKRELFIIKSVNDWKGFVASNGKEMKCTSTNKVRALRSFPWFFEFVDDAQLSLRENVEQKEKAAGKN